MKKITFLVYGFFILWSLVSFAQDGAVKGRVLDGAFPLPGATIQLSGTQKNASTDFEGNYTITGIAAGNYEMTVTYLGYEKASQSVSVEAGKVTPVPNIIMKSTTDELEEVVVSANASRRLSEAKALNIQKNSISIVNVIAADGIGKLPDRNAAEAVQRIPGVSIERDQGEGRYVAVRGLPAEWSSTTMNGNRLPTAADEGASRATAFDFFPTEMIGYVEVAKALTPDIDADALGGSVNFITKTAPSKFTADATIGAGYNEKTNKGIYSGSVLVGDKSKNGKFGYIVNLSQWNRNWASDNFEARRSGDEGVYRLELRDYTGERQTTGFNGGFEFNPNEKNKLFVKLNYGKLLDKELHYKHRIRFDKFNDATGTGRVELQNIYNELNFDFYGAEVGGKHIGNKGVLDWSAAHYSTEFYYGNVPDSKNNSYYSVFFKQDGVGFNPAFIEDRGNGPRAYWNTDGGTMNTGNMFDYLSDSNFQDSADKMNFTTLELYKVNVKERDNIVATVNYEFDANDDLKLKFGGKFRDKDRRATFADEFYNWTGNGATPKLSDYGQYNILQPGRTDYLNELGTNIGNSFGPVLSKNGMNQFYHDNFSNGNLTLSEADSEILENGGGLGRNFDVDETHTSGYGMATYKISDKLTFLGGIRATYTYTKVTGYQFDVTDENPDGVLSGVVKTKKYLSLLPMVHLKYTPEENTNLRFAATRTFTRPDFGYLVPGGTYIAADNEYDGGNPDVNPTYAYNFDLMGEHYFGKLDVVSAGVFYKIITDPIFMDTRQGNVNGHTGVEVSQPLNGDNAWLFGAEFSGNKKFDFLPGFLNGFGVQANYTYTKSEMTIPGRAGKTSLPRQGKHLANAQLYYEKGRVNVRAAYNFKAKYITEHGTSGLKRDDVYYGDYSALDANISFKLTNHFTLFAEANNLLNQKLEYYYGDESRPKQVELYGIRGQIGVKWSL
ncbi:TonB-dependent receptor [Flavobacterium rivuli WB 3.3-2 = DSM 21788]|uniref:TonB-dependent receptor n=1 Tax=Flavobacterium rivuli WB 3.3-2 = DSM 21788 TaxID=1121895 RepID=A0A0A2M1X2_9FLAO|nr:TonB-dependent receptor [Flavobacterium rivuli]KGO86622.1 TonB-dependent receptor [Flavobacterium rivuli WB 3.3-2 = DSM 21788]